MLSFCACGKTENTGDIGGMLNPFNTTDNSETDTSDITSSETDTSDVTSSETDTSDEPVSDTVTSDPASSDPDPSTSTPPTSTPPTSTPTTTQPAKNEFINSSNNFISSGDLAIRPYHVYWEGNVLHAKCFVVNGLASTARNINVTNITLSNKSGVIASASFGVMRNAYIASGTYLVWTFSFSPDAIRMQGADLSYLECDASATYQY